MKKIIKISTSLFLVLTMVLSLAGCGEIKKAETAVNNMFTAFKEINLEEAQKYVDFEDIKLGDSAEGLTSDADIYMENLFDDLEYEIISSEKIDSKTVNVTTKITAIDMEPVMSEFYVAAIQYAFSTAFADPQPTEEETNAAMEKMLIESISKPDLETVTNEVVIKVVKEDKNWKIQPDEDFADALFGGLMSAVEDIQSSFEDQLFEETAE